MVQEDPAAVATGEVRLRVTEAPHRDTAANELECAAAAALEGSMCGTKERYTVEGVWAYWLVFLIGASLFSVRWLICCSGPQPFIPKSLFFA